MGMTSFYQGSLRYDMHGRKRKTNSMKKAKRKTAIRKGNIGKPCRRVRMV